MSIRIRAKRDAVLTCPYCHDTLSEPVACPDCGTAYHAECAFTFQSCALQGCAGVFRGGGLRILPRLPVLAKRVAAWHRAWREEMQGVVVVIKPAAWSSRERPAAARRVGELIGGTGYDGRLRLAATYPEPLVQVPGLLDARALRDELAGLEVEAFLINASELYKPLQAYFARRIETGGPTGPSLLDEEGQEMRVRLSERPLLVTGELISVLSSATKIVTTQHYQGRYAAYGSSQRIQNSVVKNRNRDLEKAAFLFEPGEPIPFMLRGKDGNKLFGEAGRETPQQRFLKGVAALKGRCDSVAIQGSKSPNLLSRRNVAVGVGQERLHNLPALNLIARLMYFDWTARREARGGSSKR